MRQLSAKSTEITIVCCFTQSVYAPLATREPLLAHEVHVLRQREDREYAQRIGARYISLDLEDTSIRYPDDEELWISDSPQTEPLFEILFEQLQRVFINNFYETILCPLAVGTHQDHYLVREAVSRIIPDHSQVLYYEDLPYGYRVGGPDIVKSFAQKTFDHPTELIIDITEWLQHKVEDIQVYKSQIYPEDLAGVVQYSAELGENKQYMERFWTVST